MRPIANQRQRLLTDGYQRNSATTGVEFRHLTAIFMEGAEISEAAVVDARLDKLEEDNRRLKLTVGALLLALREAVAHCLPTR